MNQNVAANQNIRNKPTAAGWAAPKLALVLIVLFCSGTLLQAQTTVQLEQQCDCRILTGTDLDTPGSTTPIGADLGDIYINTNTGTLYFWDGDSWELTQGLNPSLGSLSFDPATYQLTLRTNDGRTFNADLSALAGGGGLTPAASDVSYDNSTSGLTAINVQEAIDAVNLIASSYPMIYATGKVNADGTAQVIFRSTVVRVDQGDYNIIFDQPLPDTRYIIQVSVLDCDGDCPGNSTETYDNPGITYYDQRADGFRVNIGDSDNGVNPKDDVDLEFMFTVITLPN